MLQIRSVSKHYGQAAAVDSVSLSVPEGSFLVLLGPSGCGKTTLLRMLAGLEMPSSGQIIFFDETVSDGDRARVVDPSRRNSGLVFQSYALWPHMTVRGNVEWPLKVAGFDRDARTARADEVLGLLDIATLADRYPNEISGGQQQRVAIARTIATRPKVLLFDEPLSNLDAKLRVEMRTELMRLHRATGATTVYVTHDQIEAMTMATHVAVMNHGRIEQFGTPEELVKEPASEFVATFVGTPPNNVVPVAPNGSGWKLGGIVTPLVPPEGAVLAMYPADALTLDEKDGICMELVEVTTMAGRAMVTGIADGLRLTAVVDHVPHARVTEKIHFHLPAEPTCWFDAQGRRIG